jgi:hypothetical protein
VKFVGDAGVLDLLSRGELQDDRQQQTLHFDATRRSLLDQLLEQDALVRHMLIDDPEAIAPGGDDEAFMDLP